MLVEIRRVVTKAADKPPEVSVEYINPDEIVRVAAVEVRGLDGDCSRVLVGEEWLTCIGHQEEFAKAANRIFANDLG